jgi:hypothetical protein
LIPTDRLSCNLVAGIEARLRWGMAPRWWPRCGRDAAPAPVAGSRLPNALIGRPARRQQRPPRPRTSAVRTSASTTKPEHAPPLEGSLPGASRPARRGMRPSPLPPARRRPRAPPVYRTPSPAGPTGDDGVPQADKRSGPNRLDRQYGCPPPGFSTSWVDRVAWGWSKRGPAGRLGRPAGCVEGSVPVHRRDEDQCLSSTWRSPRRTWSASI